MENTMTIKILPAALLGATLLGATSLPSQTLASEGTMPNRVVIYFTRHAEKQTTTVDLGAALTLPDNADGDPLNIGSNRDDLCGDSKCAEELSDLGSTRAQLLADWFDRRGITDDVTHVFSSHKVRTRQTVEEIAMRAGLNNDDDLLSDGVQQLPAGGTELNPQSTGPSEQPTIDAIHLLEPGDVAVIAGHSGTLYDIFEGLNIDTSDNGDFPKDTRPGNEGKVRDYGDVWKIVVRNGEAKFKWRKNLQPTRLRVVDTLPSPSQ